MISNPTFTTYTIIWQVRKPIQFLGLVLNGRANPHLILLGVILGETFTVSVYHFVGFSKVSQYYSRFCGPFYTALHCVHFLTNHMVSDSRLRVAL